jgi:hypothetical protein
MVSKDKTFPNEVKKKSKFKIKPYAKVGNYSNTPEKDVKVKGKSGEYGIEAEADLGSGFTISGGVGKSFDKGKVDYPGGSESWDANIPDNWRAGLKYSKKFNVGGLVKQGKPKIAKKGWR